MSAGRPKKPTAVKVLEGTFRADRAVQDEVQPDLLAEIPAPPEGLGEWGQREWFVVCKWLHNVGNLAVTDLSLIAAYCNEIDSYWQYDKVVKEKGPVIVLKRDGVVTKVQTSPYATLRKSALDNALKLAGQFGFTPSARTRLTMGQPQKAETKLDKLKRRLT